MSDVVPPTSTITDPIAEAAAPAAPTPAKRKADEVEEVKVAPEAAALVDPLSAEEANAAVGVGKDDKKEPEAADGTAVDGADDAVLDEAPKKTDEPEKSIVDKVVETVEGVAADASAAVQEVVASSEETPDKPEATTEDTVKEKKAPAAKKAKVEPTRAPSTRTTRSSSKADATA